MTACWQNFYSGTGSADEEKRRGKILQWVVKIHRIWWWIISVEEEAEETHEERQSKMILGFLAWETDFKGFRGLSEILNAHSDVWRDGIQEKTDWNNKPNNICLCEDTRG